MDLQNKHQNKINNVHDLFFRESMQDIEITRQLAILTIPQSIQTSLNWKTLEIVKENWVDENLREHRSDVIYRAKLMGEDQWVYLLFEHKSTLYKGVQVQLLSYIVEIWEQHKKQKGPGKLLPLVISIVVCHCNGICNLDNSVKEMVAIIEGTEEFVPDFRFLKLDLCSFDPKEIKDGKLKIFVLALKYSRSANLWRVLPWIIRKSEELQKIQKWQYDYLRVVLLYLMSVIREESINQFKEIVSQEHSGGRGYMETIADAFREEERLKREKAERIVAELRKEIKQKDTELEKKNTELKKERAELEKKESIIEQKDTEIEKKDEQLVKRMLEKGLDFQFIREITGLSEEKIKQLRKADEH